MQQTWWGREWGECPFKTPKILYARIYQILPLCRWRPECPYIRCIDAVGGWRGWWMKPCVRDCGYVCNVAGSHALLFMVWKWATINPAGSTWVRDLCRAGQSRVLLDYFTMVKLSYRSMKGWSMKGWVWLGDVHFVFFTVPDLQLTRVVNCSASYI